MAWALSAAALGAIALDSGGVTPGAFWNPRVLQLGFMTFALLAAYPLFVAGESDARVRVGVLLAGVAFGALLLWTSGAPGDRDPTSVARGIGLAALAALAVRWTRHRHDASASWRLAVGLMLPAFIWISHPYLHLTLILSDDILDEAIYATDATYGLSPSFAMARLFEAVPVLAVLTRYAYAALPLFVALVFVLRESRGDADESDLLVAFLGAGAAGFLFYLLLPVIGPEPAYPEAFPYDPPPLNAATPTVAMDAVRNCVPSLHTAWALLILWHSRPLATRWKVVVGVFFVLNELATLGLGFHYLFDLVVAVPFTLAIQAFAMKLAAKEARVRAASAGALLVAAWIGLAFPARLVLELHHAVPWLLTVATVTLCWRLESELWKQPGPRPGRAT